MKSRLLHRLALALIPVGLLTSVSLAFSVMTRPPAASSETVPDEVAQPAEVPPPQPVTQPVTTSPEPPKKTLVVQQSPSTATPTTETAPTEQVQVPAELVEEPLPELVVDRTPLAAAMGELNRATEQAKLAVTALDPDSQRRYIQEAVNILAGFADPAFRATGPSASADAYKGVRPLLMEARVKREAAEVQWIAAVQQQMEARAKKLAEIAQAGGSVQLPQATTDLSSAVGPSGVLGTRGVRVEEQAMEVVGRAIRGATEALNDPNQATVIMEAVVRQLEVARKIVQIAIDR
jgi:hypothetical protein